MFYFLQFKILKLTFRFSLIASYENAFAIIDKTRHLPLLPHALASKESLKHCQNVSVLFLKCFGIGFKNPRVYNVANEALSAFGFVDLDQNLNYKIK